MTKSIVIMRSERQWATW